VAASAREFFESLEERIDPERARGHTVSYRFDVDGAGSWRVGIDDGQVAVAETSDEADCVFRLSEETLLKLLRGEQKPTTAFMTGKIKVEGDLSLALKLQQLFL
jgi:putative sterol carrier protein